MSSEATSDFHLETCMNSKEIALVSNPESNASPQHHLGEQLELISHKSAGAYSFLPGVKVDVSGLMPLAVPNCSALSPVFSTTSLLLMPSHKMEVFKKLPQVPHFHEAWNCPPEFREGRALGLMVSFANMAESIKNMRIQDRPQLYQEKMSSLLDLEENGFDVHALKIRLDNLLRIKNHHVHLNNRKESLEKEILMIERVNCQVEQRHRFLGLCIIRMEEKKYQEMQNSLDMEKAANCLSISKHQVDLRQVEESLMSH